MSQADAIVAFLTAQYDELHQMAEQALNDGNGQWAVSSFSLDYGRAIEGEDFRIYDEGGHTAEQAQFIAANDPAFVLADVAAKRAALARVVDYLRNHISDDFSGEHLAEDLLLEWVRPFADRPGYDEAWRPA